MCIKIHIKIAPTYFGLTTIQLLLILTKINNMLLEDGC
jgi:hypothetical protein